MVFFLLVEITNVFFITLFTLEMLLKMYSLGIQVRIFHTIMQYSISIQYIK